MNVWKILVFVVLVIAAIYIVPRISKSTDIEQTGQRLSITVGKHQLKAAIVSGQMQDSFLVVGGSPRGDLYFTALLSVISFDTAQRLAQTYGDFRKCNSPGAAEGMRSVQTMVLYAADRAVGRKLKAVSRLATAGKDPIIKMTFVQLTITDHTIERSGQAIQVTSRDATPSFLVKDVQLAPNI